MSGTPPPLPPSGPGPSGEGASVELRVRVRKLLAAMRSVGSGLDPHATLERICATAADLAGARYAALGVLAEDGEGLADFVHHDVDAATAGLMDSPPDRPTAPGTVTDASGPARSPDPADDSRDLADDSRALGGDSRALADEPGDPTDEPGDPTGAPRDLTGILRAGGLPAAHEPPPPGVLSVPVRVQGEFFGTLYLADKRDGRAFDDHDLALVRVLAVEAGIALGNARLHASARARERWIDGSVAVTTALLSGAGPDDSLRVVAEQARRLSGAVAGIVLLPAACGGMEIAAVAGRRPAEDLGTVLAPDSGLVAGLLAGRSEVVTDAATDPRLLTGPARAYGPALVLPLRSDGRVLGGLVLLRARGERPFTRTERVLADRFAAQAALALVMAEAQRDRERLAVYEDRDRIARDLHDLVIQRLFATGMTLENAERVSAVPEVRDGVAKAVAELDVTIQEIRSAVFALRRPAETPARLRTRVLREITMAAAPLGHTPAHRFVGPVDGAVGEATGRNLLAALREALSNAYRHAHASRTEVVVDATVTLPDGRLGVRLTVADDGVGLPEGGRRSGLHNLERRAQALGGTSRTGPGIGPDGAGTTVVWEAPY
ncbi:GAF domain-containing protein [Streptomyces griseoviridis]|uniref:Histidine kinase n=1 Tax=Streptomyces griseoviridis TaxID=45398 RepID=A0A918LEX8_STRGD|nr:GAF domain-containing sensor histidine kinase [Streptomyces niveoruber]GGS38063.1 histidine kinase [Streptomyces niveoruber]